MNEWILSVLILSVLARSKWSLNWQVSGDKTTKSVTCWWKTSNFWVDHCYFWGVGMVIFIYRISCFAQKPFMIFVSIYGEIFLHFDTLCTIFFITVKLCMISFCASSPSLLENKMAQIDIKGGSSQRRILWKSRLYIDLIFTNDDINVIGKLRYLGFCLLFFFFSAAWVYNSSHSEATAAT